MGNLTAPILSLSAAVSWGAADFSGGIATKAANPFRVVVVAHFAGLIFMLALALFSGEPAPAMRALAVGAAAGMVGGIGLAAFYKSLAVGTMGINAPLSSVITALLPLSFSFVTEGLPNAVRIFGFVLALISIWVIAAPHQIGARRQQGVGLAVVAGIGFGGFLLLMRVAGTSGVFWPLASARAASCALMLLIVVASGDVQSARCELRGGTASTSPFALSTLHYMIIAGILDSGANALYVAAAQRGRLDSAAVLSSLYPASTVILARVVLKERLSKMQAAGMVAALAAVALISF
ncbi:MAG: EamA family transporter [Terriglobales bacterium]